MPVDITENFFFTEYSDGVYFNGKATANEFNTVPVPPPPPVSYGTASGYSSGGSFDRTAVEKFSFTSDGNAVDVGTLAADARNGAGQSSNEHGYTSGAYLIPSYTNTIQKFPFAADGNATDVGDLTQARGYGTGGNMSPSSSGGFGYTSAGRSQPYAFVNTIDKFPFSTDANATDVGDLLSVVSNVSSQNSETYGYISGGESPDSNTIQRFPFASDANASDVGDLTIIRRRATGQSSTTDGYVSGDRRGYPGLDTIDKFSFASNNNATQVGNLSVGREHGAGSSSNVSGYTAGGTDINTNADVIDKFPFAADGNATDVGNLVGVESQAYGHHV